MTRVFGRWRVIRRFRDLPIPLKLVLISGSVSCLALAFACTAFFAHEWITVSASFGRELGTQAKIIAGSSAAALVLNDRKSATATLEALSANGGILAAAIYDVRGRRFAAYRPGLGEATPLPETWPAGARGFSPSPDRVTVDEPILLRGDAIGRVVIQADLPEMNARLPDYALIALLVLGTSLAAAVWFAHRMQRSISGPILDLTEIARTVSQLEEYSVRAAPAGDDEIGFLVRTFNQMLDRMQKRERELKEARDVALESVRLKSAFLANMSHEIRTPLNIILGYSELLEDASRENPAFRDDGAFDSIKRAGMRLVETIDGILDLSRIETGAFELHRVPVSVPEFITRCVKDARILAEKKDLTLVCEIEESNATVAFDQHCLSQALMNLLSNAIKFTSAGRITVRLARAASGILELSVEDTGVGIAKNYLLRLFRAFSQEDSGMTRRFEGSGLGLALVKSYVELNGASVAATSEKGVGSRFVIRFAAESEVPAVPQAPERVRRAAFPEVQPPAPVSDHPTVLVVEDDPDSQDFMKRILAGEYDVILAAGAEEARLALAAHGKRIRAILMDVALRGGDDGLTLTRWLRRTEQWAAVPIIATTAHTLPDDRMQAYEAGCTAYLAKPMSRKELLRVLNEHVISGRPVRVPPAVLHAVKRRARASSRLS
ncbi:MAG: ATP-binding protein [Candidatus Binatia bacterium]